MTTDDDQRKERVLHTRVPESLEAELKERAAEMGTSVSNLVRHVLTNALGLVNDIVTDGEQLVRAARDSVGAGVRAARGQGRPAAADGVTEPVILGWQPVVLERNAVCHRCNDILPRGSDAALAVHDGPTPSAPRPAVCVPCLEELRDAARDHRP
jgi:plasmid stability protein